MFLDPREHTLVSDLNWKQKASISWQAMSSMPVFQESNASPVFLYMRSVYVYSPRLYPDWNRLLLSCGHVWGRFFEFNYQTHFPDCCWFVHITVHLISWVRIQGIFHLKEGRFSNTSWMWNIINMANPQSTYSETVDINHSRWWPWLTGNVIASSKVMGMHFISVIF